MKSVRVGDPSHHPSVVAERRHGVSLDGQVVAVAPSILRQKSVDLYRQEFNGSVFCAFIININIKYPTLFQPGRSFSLVHTFFCPTRVPKERKVGQGHQRHHASTHAPMVHSMGKSDDITLSAFHRQHSDPNAGGTGSTNMAHEGTRRRRKNKYIYI